MDWFLYDNGLRDERVKINKFNRWSLPKNEPNAKLNIYLQCKSVFARETA